MNGKIVCYFSCKRRFRQGKPLTTILFCIAEEVPRRGILALLESRKLQHVAGPKSFRTPSHVMYANDIIIFCRGTSKNIKELISLFEVYGNTSLIKWLVRRKSFFFHGGINVRQVEALSQLLEFKQSRIPFDYLRLPIFKGKPRKIHLPVIVDKVKQKC